MAESGLEEHHVRLLTLAAEAWDRAQEARVALAQHGTTYTDRFGQPRARPEVNIERDARIAFARLLRELDLDGEPGTRMRSSSGGAGEAAVACSVSPPGLGGVQLQICSVENRIGSPRLVARG